MREQPIGFRVQLLNHSDTAAVALNVQNFALYTAVHKAVSLKLYTIKSDSNHYTYAC